MLKNMTNTKIEYETIFVLIHPYIRCIPQVEYILYYSLLNGPKVEMALQIFQFIASLIIISA